MGIELLTSAAMARFRKPCDIGEFQMNSNESHSVKPWFMALRPKTLTAAVVPVIAATALVRFEGYSIVWWVSICALLSATFIQIGTNLVNDAVDFKKGADTEKRVGPQRVTQSGLLSSKQVMFGAMFCFFIAFLLGVPLVIQGGWPIVVIGVISLLLGYGYTGGPFPLAYKGLGDLFVILFFGLIAVGGTFFLHTGTVTTGSMILGLQVGLLATVLIAVNNLRDASQDVLVNKKTLAVRLGPRLARVEIAALVIVTYFLNLFWILSEGAVLTSATLLAVPLGVRLIDGVYKNEPGPIYNEFLATGAKLHLLFGVLISIAFAFSVR